MIQTTENFNYKRAQQGELKFTTSTLSDPHLQKLMQLMSAHGIDAQEAATEIGKYVAHINNLAAASPILCETAAQNAAESAVFDLMGKHPDFTVKDAPRFSPRVFNKLVRTIAAEHHGEFWPLRGFIDKRRLTPIYEFVDDPKHRISTAAATPSGRFIFNTNFMQRLMDFAHVKELTPKGKKYTCNGGDIPDEYAYIEFLIMHELMHYSHDDFYYQKIIPNAKGKIINWVGDFRTNYLLVKSGYEQLPMGLFSDHINYDRQKSYTEMYDLVKAEMEKLPQDQQSQMGDALDGMADEHETGNEEARANDKGDDATVEDINNNDKSVDERASKKTDKDSSDAAKAPAEKPGEGKEANQNKSANGNSAIDYSRIKPQFDWKSLLARFVSSAKPQPYETFMRPARRSVSNMFTARQTGAAAVKPGVIAGEATDAKLAFCIDASGSMSGVIANVMATAAKLMSAPAFKNSIVEVVKFSGSHETFACSMSKKTAAKIGAVGDKPSAMPLKISDVLGVNYGSSTHFSPEMTAELDSAMSRKWNVVVVSDSDISYGDNATNVIKLMKAHPRNFFIIFATREDYLRFREKAGVVTANVTHF